MRPRFSIPLIAAGFFLFPAATAAQEGAWTVSFFGGISAPSLKEVNETLDKTIRDWNVIQAIPIRSIDHFSAAPLFGINTSYRYDRDMAVSFSASYAKQKLNAVYKDSTVFLNLDRSAQTIDFMVGLMYFFPLLYDMEVAIVLDVGLLMAEARAGTYNTLEEKSGETTVTVVHYDSEAVYRKSKLIVDTGGTWTWNAYSTFFVKAQVLYRLGNMGQMEGEIRRLQGNIQEPSFANFDFSGFTATLGIGLTF